jgi:hypothetical protein
MFQQYKEKKGFTLVEILVVITIIILITSLVVIAIENARIKTRNTIIMTGLEQIQAIGETVYNPVDGYKKLWEMRGDMAIFTNDHPTLKEIREKIYDIGGERAVLVFFRDGGSTEKYNDYCAYAFLYPRNENNIVYCIDHLGNKTTEMYELINCTDLSRPANCLNR